MNRRRFQAGISLIELMVALLIGSFLVLGVTQIYIDNRRSYAFQQSQGENQENSRYTMLVLQQELEKVGYRRLPDIEMEWAFPANSTLAGCSFVKGQTVLWDNATNSLCIRYQPRTDTDRDCLGNFATGTVPTEPYTEASAMFIERLYLDGDRLMCASSTNPVPGELIAGVADLRFEFGVATDPRVLDHYVAHGNVTDDIVTIRYAALLRSSGGQVRDTSADSPVLDQWQTISGISNAAKAALNTNDAGQLYQISQSTVMLRNLMP